MKTRIIAYTVEGAGEFPIDMLRYDRSFPRSEHDSISAQQLHGIRKVELTREAAPMHWEPTAGRWDSFNWHVIEVREVK